VLDSLPKPKGSAPRRTSATPAIAKLETLSYPKAQALAAKMVPELFPGRAPRKAMSVLDETQRAFLTTLMVEGIGTPGGELDRALEAHGLPGIEALPAMTGVARGLHRDYRRR
jgi:hypothetical protein